MVDNARMAAYTTPDPEALAALCARLDLGAPVALEPVAAGVENSTWLLSLDVTASSGGRSEWVLTIVERLDAEALRFPTAVCAHLQAVGLPVPAPRAAADGARVHRLRDKPALLSPKAPGCHPQRATPAQCRAIGDFLGSMHLQSPPERVPARPNPYGYTWLAATASRLESRFSEADRGLLADHLARYRTLAKADELPCGIIHADLFRDNALFEGERLTAVIDFNSACIDWLLLDVAIALHDWAGQAEGRFDAARAAALLGAYTRRRPPQAVERALWPELVRLAALRFWMSRALALLDAPAELTGRAQKDPAEFRARLAACLRPGNIPVLPNSAG